MKKCEWKDGKFEPCEGFNPVYESFSQIIWCNSCNADIRKPEPEKPLIVKSGGTWVAHWKGVDYLLIMGTKKETPPSLFYTHTETTEVAGAWKPFSEIEKEGLTDEIAKLRPIVVEDGYSFKYILWGIDTSACILADKTHSIFWKNIEQISLATPHELQANL